jgi:hypothetical protein
MPRLAIFLMLLLTACDAPRPGAAPAANSVPAQPPADTVWVVTPGGYGPVRIGAPREVAAAALGAPLPLDRASMISEKCGHVRVPKGAPGVGLMIVNDTVVRVEVYERGIRTAAGDQIGDAEAEVARRYAGRVRVEPHAYRGPEGHYLVVPAEGDTTRQLIFETDGSRVIGYRAGRLPEVTWVEGCA